MNKFERQSRQPADQQTLPEAIAGDLSKISSEVIDVSDAPPIVPRTPLTPDEVRTILISLMLTMFLAARLTRPLSRPRCRRLAGSSRTSPISPG